MKAAKVLRRYAEGDRKFCGLNLRGQSFKGQNLSGADFSGSDIRGADFSRANLPYTNFSQSRAGLSPRTKLLWIITLLILSTLAGLLLGIALNVSLIAFIPPSLLEGDNDYIPWIWLIGRLTLVLWLILGFIAIRLGPFASRVAGTIAITIAVILCLFGNVGSSQAWAAAAAITTAIVGNLSVEVAIPSIIATLRVITKNNATVWLVAGTTANSAVATILFIASNYDPLLLTGFLRIFMMTAICLSPFALTTLGAFMGCRFLSGKGSKTWLREMAIALGATGGTQFRLANLMDADFSQAILRNSDFRRANLTRSRWFKVQGLDLARVNRTYLEDDAIRDLVISAEGRGGIFSYKDLRGVNLQGADLSHTEFIGANLSDANFENANLTYVKLAQAQLYRANLKGANLTGACIQDWGISADTQFDDVQCDYVYMHLTTRTDQDSCRKPDNRDEVFSPGDFVMFTTSMVRTKELYEQQDVDLRSVAETMKIIDLFHHEGIDPSAAAIALQELAEQHPEAGIEVVALEGRDHEKVRMQVMVSPEANRSILSAQYSEKYQKLKSLPYSDLHDLLLGIAEKDKQIYRLQTMLEQAIQQPRFYVETYHQEGELIMSQSKGNIRFDHVQGNISGVAAAGETQTFTGSTLGDIRGTVTNTINQLSVSPDPNNPGVRELLSQLQSLIESEDSLSEEDKTLALEQVNVLAEAAQKPGEGALKKAAKTSMLALKGIVASIPTVTDCAGAITKLLAALSGLLCLV